MRLIEKLQKETHNLWESDVFTIMLYWQCKITSLDVRQNFIKPD